MAATKLADHELSGALRQRYDIVVRGRLSERYESAFDGVTLEPRNGETTLRAEIADQSQLYGLLNRLRDFGIELISINAAPESAMQPELARPPAGARWAPTSRSWRRFAPATSTPSATSSSATTRR